MIGACKDPSLEFKLRELADGDDRISLEIHEEVVPDEELEAVIDAHDAAVLPYRNILNSGSALHALSRNKPVLAPRMGSLPELLATVGPEWVHLFDGEINSEAIEQFLSVLELEG